MSEEKQLENSQESTAAVSESLEAMESEPMSAEANLPTENQSVEQVEAPTPVHEVSAQGGEEAFTLEQEDGSPGEENLSAEQMQAESQARIKELTKMIQELKTQLDQQTAQTEERNQQYMRIAADFENFRRRTQKEKEELDLKTKCATIRELLPVIDNFERARSQLKPQTDAEMNIHKSYQGIYKQMVDTLKQIGVSPMRAEGQEFDPNLHEAVMREPTHEYPEGSVIEELQRGYVLGDQVLRHALVKVATAPEEDAVMTEEQPNA